MKKFTICVTNRCNLRCDYCYAAKGVADMDAPMAAAIVDWIFARTDDEETIDVALFGGEPFVAFRSVRDVVSALESHPRFDPGRVILSVVSNGTIFSDRIARFLREHRLRYCMSLDGPPEVQDRFRHFTGGRGSSELVERNARAALAAFGGDVPVNAVYRPETFRRIPDTIRHLQRLGFRHIYLSPDLSAPWTPSDAEALEAVFEEVADLYIDAYLSHEPLFVSTIDGKIAVLLRGGYRPEERCQMGTREFAFTPDGKIYPCERLIGCSGDAHRIGSVGRQHLLTADRFSSGGRPECAACSLRESCMHWCGCSNFFATGDYARPGAVLCAAERAAIAAAWRAFETIERELGPTFIAHFSGRPSRVADGTC